MAILVHITDAELRRRVERSGLRPARGRAGIYCMPVTKDHLITHQWAREMRRKGIRTLLAVHFRMPNETPAWIGRYNEEHRQTTVGAAVRALMNATDPLGFEMIIAGPVPANAITALRELRKPIGWRHAPDAHGKAPCGCPMCQPRGAIGGTRIRAERDPLPPRPRYADAKRTLLHSDDRDILLDALRSLYVGHRRDDPLFLERIIAFGDVELAAEVAQVLTTFRHRSTRRMLARLARHPDPAVCAAADESLGELDAR